MKENIQTGNTGISQDKIGTAADDNTVLFCCELKDQLFLSLVNSIMGTEIACRVIQNVVQKSALRLRFSPSRSISSWEYPLLAAACFAKSRS
mgnify:FL=1